MPKIISKKTVWTGKNLEVVEIYWKDGKGVGRKWKAVDRTNGPNVVLVTAITEKDEIVLVKEFRPPVNAEVIGLPAGRCDIPGEYIKDTAQRELEEETGYTAEKLTKLFSGPVSAGLSSEFLTVYLAEGLKLAGKKIEEKIEVYKIPLECLEEWFAGQEERGILVDVKTRAFARYAKEKLGGY